MAVKPGSGDDQEIQDNVNMPGVIIDEFDSSMPSLKKIPVKKASQPVQTKKSVPRKEEFTIRLPDEVKNRIPRDFNLNVIGSIDLGEAEKIAKEDIVFLTENDLIEGLEEFDLIPLKKNISHEQETKPSPRAALEPMTDVTETEIYDEDTIEYVAANDDEESVQSSSLASSEDLYEEGSAGGNDLSLEPLIVDDEDKPEKAQVTRESVSRGRGSVIHDLVIEEIDDEEHERNEISENRYAQVETYHAEDAEGLEEIDLIPVRLDDEVLPAREAAEEDLIIIGQEATGPSQREHRDPYREERDGSIDNIFDTIEKEIIPEEIRELERINEQVLFIDDEIISRKKTGRETIFEENKLEAIAPDVAEISDGRVIILEEADKDKDREKIAHASFVSAGISDDVFLEFEDDEYKYKDDELDFVDNAVFEEDYGRYVREIDDLYGIQGPKQASTAVEIFGLNTADFELIEERLFFEEYKNVNLDEIFNLIKFEFSPFGAYDDGERYCNYILPDAESFYESERRSIEEDISGKGALIFEEDVGLIKQKLGRDVVEVKSESVEIVDSVYDITDKIVIIEDDLDVDRFVREFPDEQQTDIKKLLKYLDGLFEKLPEDVVKKFASSEYFDLYVNVLHEIGV